MYDNENNNFVNDNGESENTGEINTESNTEEINSSQQTNYTYYDMNSAGQNNNSDQQDQNDKKNKKEKKNKTRTTGGKFGLAIAMAAVVGVVAGGAFYGVNAAANAIAGSGASASAEADTDSSSSSFEESISGILDGDSSTSDSSESTENTDSNSGVTTTTGSEDEMTVEEVAAACLPSVVTIASVSEQELSSIFGGTQSYETTSAGTGVIIGQNDSELLIATNNHVVSSADSLSVGFIDESTVEASIKGQDADNDLAVIAVSLDEISADTLSQISIATIGDSDELQLGEQVVAIGNALGYGQSVTSGYVSAKDRSLTLTDGTYTFESTGLIQTDAAINAGNSGGALLNMKGELVGINEAKSSSSSSGSTVEGMGYAIAISKAEPILEELMTQETRTKVDESERGYLGITCANVTSDVASMYNMPEGICITGVVEGSPAETGGLQKGDVITAVEGYSVSTYDDLTEQLEYYATGDTITLTIQRSDNGSYVEQSVSVTLGDSSIIEDYNSSSSDSSSDSDSSDSGNDYYSIGQ